MWRVSASDARERLLRIEGRAANVLLCLRIVYRCVRIVFSAQRTFSNVRWFGIAMGLVENLRVGEERAEAGRGAEEDEASAILGAGEVGRVGVAEDASAQGDELRGLTLLLQSTPRMRRAITLWG